MAGWKFRAPERRSSASCIVPTGTDASGKIRLLVADDVGDVIWRVTGEPGLGWTSKRSGELTLG